MSRRIDIELTSSLDDGSWTWRAAGARQPKGVLSGSILPTGSKVGDVLKVEVEQEIDGITVLSVVHGREKQGISGLLELLPVEREFQPVVETRARRERGERPRRDDRDRGDRPPRGDRNDRGDRRGGDRRDGRGGDGRGGDARGGDGRRGEGRGGDGRGGDSRRRDGGGRERRGPSFTPPPEVPQRPKPKRLRPGKSHRQAVLGELAAEQRPIAELALQGMSAVRQRLREENDKAKAEGRAVMPEATVLKMAEELLPKLRVAEWRDRAEAAKEQADELDLRDLRSVVAAGDDPMVARDETTRTLADELKTLLLHKQEQELVNWFGDIDAALAVGRVIRALRLSSQPPKAGVPFPADIAQRLVESTNASLAPMDPPDRWAAMLEAAAFSPVRTLVKPIRKPDVLNDELTATVTRLAPALPHVAALFEITVDPKAPMPKPLRPTGRPTGKGGKPEGGKPDGDRSKRGDRPERGPKPAPKPAAAAPAGDAPPSDEPAADPTTAIEATPVPAVDAAAEAPATDEPAADATTTIDEAAAPAVDEAADAQATDAADEPAADEATEAPASDEPAADATTTIDEAAAPAVDEAADAPATGAPAEAPAADSDAPAADEAQPAEDAPTASDESVSEEPPSDETA